MASRTPRRGAPSGPGAASGRPGGKPDLSKVIGHLLRKSHLLAQRCFAEAFDGTGISPVQYALLCTIADTADISHKDMARAVATAPSVVTTALKPLIIGGHVLQSRDPTDARSIGYRLTAGGAAYLQPLHDRLALASKRLEAPLTAAEADTLRLLLGKLLT